MDLNKRLVVISLEGLDSEQYSDFDNASGYGGVDQILMGDVVIVSKEMEKGVRETVAEAREYFSD